MANRHIQTYELQIIHENKPCIPSVVAFYHIDKPGRLIDDTVGPKLDLIFKDDVIKKNELTAYRFVIIKISVKRTVVPIGESHEQTIYKRSYRDCLSGNLFSKRYRIPFSDFEKGISENSDSNNKIDPVYIGNPNIDLKFGDIVNIVIISPWAIDIDKSKISLEFSELRGHVGPKEIVIDTQEEESALSDDRIRIKLSNKSMEFLLDIHRNTENPVVADIASEIIQEKLTSEKTNPMVFTLVDETKMHARINELQELLPGIRDIDKLTMFATELIAYDHLLFNQTDKKTSGKDLRSVWNRLDMMHKDINMILEEQPKTPSSVADHLTLTDTVSDKYQCVLATESDKSELDQKITTFVNGVNNGLYDSVDVGLLHELSAYQDAIVSKKVSTITLLSISTRANNIINTISTNTGGKLPKSEKAKKTYRITINAREKIINHPELAYYQVVELYHTIILPPDPNTLFTITYQKGKNKSHGQLIPGQIVKVKDGMIFNVAVT